MAEEHVGPAQAAIERTAEGLRPSGEGWFVVNLADLAARGNARLGITCSPEPSGARFEEFGYEAARVPWPPTGLVMR